MPKFPTDHVAGQPIMPRVYSAALDGLAESQDLHQAIARKCPIGHRLGIDICDVERVKGIINGGTGHDRVTKFSTRILTSIELQLQEVPEIRKAEHLAGRWAAKEAIIKAMSSKADVLSRRKTFMQDIIILPTAILEAVDIVDFQKGTFNAKPGTSLAEARTRKGPLRAFVRCGPGEASNDWREVVVSISHDGKHAVAVAFIEGALPGEAREPAAKVESPDSVPPSPRLP